MIFIGIENNNGKENFYDGFHDRITIKENFTLSLLMLSNKVERAKNFNKRPYSNGITRTAIIVTDRTDALHS